MAIEETFNRSIDRVLACLDELDLDILRDIQVFRLKEAEQAIDQRYELETYDVLAQKWHILRTIFSIYSPEW